MFHLGQSVREKCAAQRSGPEELISIDALALRAPHERLRSVLSEEVAAIIEAAEERVGLENSECVIIKYSCGLVLFCNGPVSGDPK